MSVMGGPCISDRSCLSSHSCRSARAMMETPWLMSCDALTCASTAGVSCLDERRPSICLSLATSGVRSSNWGRSEEHTSELQSRLHLVCRLLLEKKKQTTHVVSSDLENFRSKHDTSRDLCADASRPCLLCTL